MKIVIVGEGKVGLLLAERLSREEHDVTVIDRDAEVLNESQESLDILTVEGNGADLSVLNEAGVDDADILIATTNADETNLLCCLTAKKLGCKRTIARVRNPYYVRQALFLKDELGLSLAVNPELSAAQEIYRLIQFPSFLKRDSFEKGRVELVEFQVTENGSLNGKKIMEAASVLGLRVLVCAVERDNTVTIPNGRFVMKSGDRITVTAERNDLATLITRLGLARQEIRNAMIIGCSRVAEYLTEELIKSGISVKMIEKDRKVCEKFALRFPDAVVINGDASKNGFLESEGVKNTDAVITLTGIDEENIIISMYCTHIGVKKTVTKIDRTEYTRLFTESGLGSTVCPKELTANEIIRYVRALSNSGAGGTVKTLHRIIDGKAEALAFSVDQDAQFCNVPLSKLRVKNDTLVACIIRGEHIIIPKGTDIIEKGDTVIVVTLADMIVGEIRDIFEKDLFRE